MHSTAAAKMLTDIAFFTFTRRTDRIKMSTAGRHMTQ